MFLKCNVNVVLEILVCFGKGKLYLARLYKYDISFDKQSPWQIHERPIP